MIMENSLHPESSNISLYIIISTISKYQILIHSYREFLALEDIPNIEDGKLRYNTFVKAYNETREHGGINGLTPSKMFLQRLITSSTHTTNKQQSVTHVGNQKCNLSS